MTTTTLLRKKGQFTIPVSIRQEIGLEENDTLTVSSLGEKAFIVIPQKLKTPALLAQSAALAKKKGVTLEEMLAELDEIRHKS